MLVVRAIPGLGVAAPLSPVLGPLHGRTGEIPRYALKRKPNRTYDTSEDPVTPVLGAPEGIVEFPEHLFYYPALITAGIK